MKWLLLITHLSLALAEAGRKKPLVSPDDFPSTIRLKDLLKGTQQLEDFAYAYPERNRVFGSAAHNDTVNFLYRELKKTGYYNVWKQPQVHTWTTAKTTLTLDGEAIEASAMTYSPSADVTAELAVVSNLGCKASDYPSDVAGGIALVKRGECTFGEKSVLAAAAKAAAVIVYNNEEGSVSGTLGGVSSDLGPYAAIAGISDVDGKALLSAAAKGAVTLDLAIDSRIENRTTFNVIAETKGGDHNNVVSLGGHTDSVEAGPGINDDGSGIISNLVVAKALTRYSVKNAVRFFFWTAEEFGLLGSEYYTSHLSADELAKIRLYLNFDMIASPNYALMIYDGDGDAFNQTGPAGSAQIEALFENYFKSKKLSYIPTEFDGRSDYDGFISRGIPAGGLFTGAEGLKTEAQAKLFGGQANVSYDVNYHAVGDDFKNLNHEAFLINSKATAFAVAKYANSLDSIPRRSATPAKRVVKKRAPRSHAHTKKLTGGLYHGKKKPYLFQSERQQKASKGLWYSWAIVAHATPMAYFMNHGEMDAYGLRKYHVAELVVGTILGNPTLFFAHMRFPDEVTKRMVLKPQDVLERYVYEPDQLPIKDINNPTEKYQSLAISSLGLEEW